ncbi:hypothetical protein CDAR_40511 [Caerostris darwini]|uniref:Uncharacterized protein n=1 Tax=Caerostris darwini TaxID=1538125 RepID=A0AAV4R937_9ARAC|nr:hypothetical protein CDAR_40511 [Caerostris darwini]
MSPLRFPIKVSLQTHLLRPSHRTKHPFVGKTTPPLKNQKIIICNTLCKAFRHVHYWTPPSPSISKLSRTGTGPGPTRDHNAKRVTLNARDKQISNKKQQAASTETTTSITKRELAATATTEKKRITA